MVNKMKPWAGRAAYILLWLVFAVLVTLTLFQVHGTLIAIAVAVVASPTLRPYGWTTHSVYALGRILWLILGILWLGWVMFTPGYLREGYEYEELTKRAGVLAIILGVTYGICLLFLFLLR